MPEISIPEEALRAVHRIRRADIVVGIPSYNNVRTIGQVVQAAQAGLAKYFPQFSAVIINSDGGSKDGTREAVVSARIEDTHLLLLSTLLFPVRRLAAAVRVVVLFVAVVAAADQLNFARSVFLAAFVILLGGAVLTASLALGLAGRECVRDHFQGKAADEEERLERSLRNHL